MFWLDDLLRHFDQRVADGALTHGLMLAGRRGLGKRYLAVRLAERFLDLAQRPPIDPLLPMTEQVPPVPDFHLLAPMEGKQQISVDQVRELGQQFVLKSHSKAGKVAIVCPADRMTIAAANSLLKTLEEPTADSLLILVSDEMSRIPATIASRSSIYRIRPPDTQLAIDWLVAQGLSETDAEHALRLVEGAPLAARRLVESEGLETVRQVTLDLVSILDEKASPMTIAGRWKKRSFDDVLMALRSVVTSLIYSANGAGMRSASGFADYVMDTRDVFCYLDEVDRVMMRTPGSYNPDLAIEALLLPWVNAFKGCYSNSVRAAH